MTSLKYIPALILFLVAANAFSQVTQFQLQVDFDKSVIQVGNVLNTADGGYVTCGTLQDINGKYPFLVKISNFGQLEWNIIYQTSALNATGQFVIPTANGGYMMVGESVLNNQNNDIFVLHTDSIGNQVWNKTYGNSGLDFGNNILQLPSGNFLLFGESDTATKKGIIVRIDGNGDVLETNYLEIIYGKALIKGKLVGANQVIVTGTGVTEVFTDTSGIYQGQSNIQLMDTAITADVMITASGKHITIANMMGISSSGHQLYLTSLDSILFPEWNFKYGTSAWTVWATSLFSSGNGGYIIAGQIDQWFGSPGFLFLSEIDSTGIMVWEKLYAPGNANGPFRFGGATSTNNGGYILTGSGLMPDGKYDLFFLKTDSAGNTGCFDGFNLLANDPANFTTPITINSVPGLPINTGSPVSITDTSFASLNVLCYTSVNDVKPTSSLYELLPNPFFNYLRLSTKDQNSGPYELTIYNAVGAMKLNMISDDAEWSGSEFEVLPKGMYMATVKICGIIMLRSKLVH